ncbi:MAG: ABC transporter permease subunit [Chloroflexi bacterium]|nr:ABC transporter permease subunit [Chloroflexota bacterium]
MSSNILRSNVLRRRQRVLGFNLLPNYVILALLLLLAIAPLSIVVFNAFKTSAEIGRNPLGLPTTIVFDNFAKAWQQGNYAITLKNTVILVIGTVVAVLVFGGMAAYSLARLDLPGAALMTLYFLVISSLPVQLYLVPLFYLWNKLGLVNNLFGLMIIYVALQSPFSVFLLRSYMLQLPKDFEDAARVDGANEVQVFTRVVVPLSWPSFLTVGLIVSLYVWNEFLMASVFLTNSKLFTVVTSYYYFATRFSRDWSLTSAGAIMMTIPILVIFLSMQRRFIAGLTQGGLKG